MKYSLQRCYSVGGLCGNNQVAEVVAKDLTEAIELLKPHCPVPLDHSGYGKEEITFVVCEVLGS
jgi:hypothetical protein